MKKEIEKSEVRIIKTSVKMTSRIKTMVKITKWKYNSD